MCTNSLSFEGFKHGLSIFLHNYYFFTHLKSACVFVHYNTNKPIDVHISTFPWHLNCTFCSFSQSFHAQNPLIRKISMAQVLKVIALRSIFASDFFSIFQTKQFIERHHFDSMVHFLSQIKINPCKNNPRLCFLCV